MGMKIWELHGLRLEGAIRSTPEGDADVAGLVFSEKAYLLAVRDFRPAELVALIEQRGAIAMAHDLVAHYEESAVVPAVTGGRGLVLARGSGPEPMLRRSDEAPAPRALVGLAPSRP